MAPDYAEIAGVLSGRGGRRVLFACALIWLLSACNAARIAAIAGNNFTALFANPRPVVKLRSAPVPGARLVATWIGHATVLLQLGDRFILTDPVFTDTVGMISPRIVEPGMNVEDLPPIDVVVISHLHFDHLSLGTLDLLERNNKMRHLVVPSGGSVYVPRGKILPRELSAFEQETIGGIKITATPVVHKGWRYGLDQGWMTRSYTGYMMEYQGVRVYFGGDTAYHEEMFRQTRRRAGVADLALLPIAPIHPREFMCRSHTDPREALDVFEQLGARQMLPIHFGTFINSLDTAGEPEFVLRQEMLRRGLGKEDVVILSQGQRHVFLGRQTVSTAVRPPGFGAESKE